MNGDIAVFQIITKNGFKPVLTGAVLGLCWGTGATAQTAGSDLAPIRQTPPSVESYSLPPGPDSKQPETKLQGPVDPEIPLAKPTVVAPRATPATNEPAGPAPASADPAPSSSNLVPAPPAAENAEDQNRQQPRQVPRQPSPAEEKPAAETGETPSASVAAAEQRPSSSVAPAETNSPPLSIAAAPPPSAGVSHWLWLMWPVAGLLVVLLALFLIWRARRVSARPPVEMEAEVVKPSLAGSNANKAAPLPAIPVQPSPGIAIGFQPRAANATLINAVLAFELTLSNQSGEVLTDIRINGAMVQAGGDDHRAPVLADLAPLQELQNLGSGEEAKVLSEFRIPLASINPIRFQSQALFVPMVHIAMEYTDGSGIPQVQTAAFLIGREHEPPRTKMAPFRLDLGPRSFTPLGFRALAAG